MALNKYKEKRTFDKTPEPKGEVRKGAGPLTFVVQKHNASRLHYDFRLELDGVLKSWAVPKGPSMNPVEKRLAMMVEDHPFEYRNFEGIIPKGNYGAGEVIIWDEGKYFGETSKNRKEIEAELMAGLKAGKILFSLEGQKLRGLFTLFRIKAEENSWLMVKKKDEFATTTDITKSDRSVRSGITIEELAPEKHVLKKEDIPKKGRTKASPNTSAKLSRSPSTRTKSSKSEKSIEKEIKIDRQTIKLTNLQKYYWPDEKITKGELLEYYKTISTVILPYLKNRCHGLHRNPNGVIDEGFYQQDVGESAPAWLKTYEQFSESRNETIRYLVCKDRATLLYMANMGCIEIHPWHSRITNVERPDYLVLDLDPTEIDFEAVIETGLIAKAALTELKIPAYCKTSGARGLHIYVPLGAKYTYEQVNLFAELLAERVHERAPDITSLEKRIANRKGKVFLDFLRNSQGLTVAAPYSARPVSGARVSTPLEWSELKKGLSTEKFTIKTLPKRIEKKGDLFAGVLGKGISLKEITNKLAK